MRKKIIFLYIFSIVITSLIFSQQLFINEFMANNRAFGEDPDAPGEYDDWLEIYNPDINSSFDLEGLYLTNDLSNLTKWEIPAGNIVPANGFLVFMADNQEFQGNNHTNFTLAESGGEIALVDRNGTTILDSHTYGNQLPDISEGRVPDGTSNWQSLANPSPGSSNSPEEGPYFDQIYSATSEDGINWTVIDELIFDHASVPGAVYFNNKIYLYFVNAADPQNTKLSVGISEDGGDTFDLFDVVISGSNSPNPVDPNAIVENGKIRLTYLGNLDEGVTNNIVTASSNDGINFVEDNIIYSGNYYDPDLFFDENNNEWVLLLGEENSLIKTTSQSPTSYFAKDDNFSWERGNIPETRKIGSSYYTYYVGDMGISVTEYQNGALSEPPLAEGIIDFNGRLNADPTVISLPRGNYLMYFKTKAEDEPLPVILSSFTANYSQGNLTIAWTTQSENGNLGWNVYRSLSDCFQNSLRINSQLIAGAGTISEPTNYNFQDESSLQEGVTYFYWLESKSFDGTTAIYGPVSFTIPQTDNENPDNPNANDNIVSLKNYPNPMSNGTMIEFYLSENDNCILGIYNLKGELIQKIGSKNFTPGIHRIPWNGKNKFGKNVSSGLYLAKIKTIKSGKIYVSKILKIK